MMKMVIKCSKCGYESLWYEVFNDISVPCADNLKEQVEAYFSERLGKSE